MPECKREVKPCIDIIHHQPYAQPYPQPYPQPYGYPGVNMGPGPTVYAAPPPQPAQMFTSGVPGAPPTFAVETDPGAMSAFGQPQPRPKKSFTLKKGRVGFAPTEGQGQEEQSGGSANIRITVSKMN